MNVGDVVQIRGKSQKGKSRVREHGEVWEVKKVDGSVDCLGSRPGVLLEATDGYCRWTAIENDRDFEIKRV